MKKPMITKENLRGVVDLLNRLVGARGYYVLDSAYGGTALHTDDGRDVLNVGHPSKSELYHLMHAFASGLVEVEYHGGKIRSPKYIANPPRSRRR